MTRFVRICLITALAVLLSAPAFAQSTIFVVRHAERADQDVAQGALGAPAKERSGAPGSGAEPRQDMMATDPDLSAGGRARAESLAAILKDAGVGTIFVTQYKRTQQTAAPLAKALGVTPTEVGSRELDSLAQKVRAAGGTVLVVGHSNSVPNLLKALGVDTPIEIAETEYDNLFVVTLGEKVTMVRLRFK